LGTAFLGAGTILGVSLLSILIGVVSLLGLGFGLRYLYRSFFNYPGGFGYTPSLASGTSRFKKSKYKIVRFGNSAVEYTTGMDDATREQEGY